MPVASVENLGGDLGGTFGSTYSQFTLMTPLGTVPCLCPTATQKLEMFHQDTLCVESDIYIPATVWKIVFTHAHPKWVK